MNEEIFRQYVMQYVGISYLWGGNSPLTGLDCSGFALEILRAFGFPLPDMTANDIYAWGLGQRLSKDIKCGSLLFFGKNGKVTHIAIALNRALMIEAGGGGSATTSKDAAARHNAYVRVRPIASRKDLVASLYPNYSF